MLHYTLLKEHCKDNVRFSECVHFQYNEASDIDSMFYQQTIKWNNIKCSPKDLTIQNKKMARQPLVLLFYYYEHMSNVKNSKSEFFVVVNPYICKLMNSETHSRRRAEIVSHERIKEGNVFHNSRHLSYLFHLAGYNPTEFIWHIFECLCVKNPTWRK